jgi:hypothetical protein
LKTFKENLALEKQIPGKVAFFRHSTISFINRFPYSAMMVNYFRLIDPYLFGTLSPEEQVAFERQLLRNPALANEFRMRFSLVRVLLANPDYLPFRSSFRALGAQTSSAAKNQLPAWAWQAFLAVAFMSAGLIFGNLLS